MKGDREGAAREMNSLNFADATDQVARGAVQYLGKTGSRSATPVSAWVER